MTKRDDIAVTNRPAQSGTRPVTTEEDTQTADQTTSPAIAETVQRRLQTELRRRVEQGWESY